MGKKMGRKPKYATEEERKAARKAQALAYLRSPLGKARMSRSNRKAALKRVGATPEMYNAMYQAQGGLCAICKTDKPDLPKGDNFAVDHCHKTKRVRGLLCNRCNLVLGKAEDDPLLLEAMAAYLRKRAG